MPEPKPARDWRQVYTVRDQPDVTAFLKKHPFLLSLLSDAYERIQEHFPGSQAFLEVVTDPEEGDRELVLSIATDLTPADAVRHLEKLDHEWWLGVPDRQHGKLCITLE